MGPKLQLSAERRPILVLGTLAYETALIPEKSGRTFLKTIEWVGAPIIHEMIAQALAPGSESTAAPPSPAIHPLDPVPDETVKAECGELTTIFSKYPRRSDGKTAGAVWRVKENYRAWSNAQPPDANGAYGRHWEKSVSACPNPSLVVLYIQDDTCRVALQRLAAARATLPRGAPDRRHLIVALADDVHEETIEAARSAFGRGPMTVLVTADGLRRRGLDIVAHGSIEQTVEELSTAISAPPIATMLPRGSRLIVIFEETGAVCFDSLGRSRHGSIHFCPNFDRVAQMDNETYGRVPGRMAIALTAVTRAVWRAESTGSPLEIDGALRLAVAAFNLMFDKGFDGRNPFDTVKGALSDERRKELRELLEADSSGASNTEHDRILAEQLMLSSLSFPANANALRSWSRLDSVLQEHPDKASRIVTHGVERTFRSEPGGRAVPQDAWVPRAHITCPFMRVGVIRTFDRREIEQFTDLAKLMRKYYGDERWRTPLSIAVFGPPGAGKSFAVKQLMKAVNPTIKASSILTFNLAQFDALELLTEAFHRVQDQALSSEDVPLVIFDEFDSSFQGSALGWLKYFLAPMEDGVFRGRTADYKVGRAVFLFAGGTADTFHEFVRNAAGKKAVKLPDFASRLMAHLDVLGINPPSDASTESPAEKLRRKVRRATLLRSLLLDFSTAIIRPDHTARIDTEVVDAFLHDDVMYKNGARSMKALVRGSRLNRDRFLVASLPTARLIDVHADRWPLRASTLTTRRVKSGKVGRGSRR